MLAGVSDRTGVERVDDQADNSRDDEQVVINALEIQSSHDTDKDGKPAFDAIKNGQEVVGAKGDMMSRLSAHVFFRYTAYSYDHLLL